MKQILHIVCAVVLTLATITASAQSRRFLRREVALISYDLNVDQEYLHQFQPLEGQFHQPQNNKLNPILNTLYNITWEQIKKVLETQTGMYILPIDAYGKKFSYNHYGYPNTLASKAIKKGESKYYLKFDISLKPDDASLRSVLTANKDTTNVPLGPNQIQPTFKIDIVIFSNKGVIPVCKASVETKSPGAIDINDALFDGFINDRYSNETSTLYGLWQTTVQKLPGSIFANL